MYCALALRLPTNSNLIDHNNVEVNPPQQCRATVLTTLERLFDQDLNTHFQFVGKRSAIFSYQSYYTCVKGQSNQLSIAKTDKNNKMMVQAASTS